MGSNHYKNAVKTCLDELWIQYEFELLQEWVRLISTAKCLRALSMNYRKQNAFVPSPWTTENKMPSCPLHWLQKTKCLRALSMNYRKQNAFVPSSWTTENKMHSCPLHELQKTKCLRALSMNYRKQNAFVPSPWTTVTKCLRALFMNYRKQNAFVPSPWTTENKMPSCPLHELQKTKCLPALSMNYRKQNAFLPSPWTPENKMPSCPLHELQKTKCLRALSMNYRKQNAFVRSPWTTENKTENVERPVTSRNVFPYEYEWKWISKLLRSCWICVLYSWQYERRIIINNRQVPAILDRQGDCEGVYYNGGTFLAVASSKYRETTLLTMSILNRISLKFVPEVPIDDLPTMVYWRGTGDMPFLDPMLIMLSLYGSTWPQRVKKNHPYNVGVFHWMNKIGPSLLSQLPFYKNMISHHTIYSILPSPNPKWLLFRTFELLLLTWCVW